MLGIQGVGGVFDAPYDNYFPGPHCPDSIQPEISLNS